MCTHRVLMGMTFILTMAQANQHQAADLEVPASRGFARAVVIDDAIYYFGGGSSNVDILDLGQGKWSQASLGMSSTQLLGDAIDGQLYVMDVISRKFRRFDPKTKRTLTLSDLPTRRVNGTVVAADGKLYVIGGYSEDVTAKNCVEVYDPKTNRWSAGPSLPDYHPLDHFHAAAVLDGKLHVVGGLLEGNEGQPHWRLDGDRWTKCAEPPLHTMWKHVALVAAAGKIYLFAPHPVSPKNQSIEVEHNIHAYDPKTDRWEPMGRTPEGMPIVAFAQAVAGEKVYLLGGAGSKAVRVFNTRTNAWE